MKSTFQVAALLTLSTVAAQAQDSKTDLAALDGSWKVVAIQIGGKKVPVGRGNPDKIVIKDGKITIWALEKPFAVFKDGELKLDAKQQPKTIDIVLAERGFTVPGIYELTEAELKLAIPKAPASSDETLERPQSFETRGNKVMVLFTKRNKD